MSQIKDTVFNAYDFSPEEYPQAATFSELQLYHLKTNIAQLAMQKVNLAYDPLNPNIFAFEHEFLRGGIAALEYLIIAHEQALELMQELNDKRLEDNRQR